MSAKKYAKNLMDFVKKEDERQKLTVLISSDNKKKIGEYGINASKLIDAFLSDFFAEIEKEKAEEKPKKEEPAGKGAAGKSAGLSSL